ncbi:cation:proton antiporter [Candidatus Micrarchaeota archaeon]|nr:cation:proton antiporter [Candidatus Micrarchaeota archaeon]
MAGIGEFGIVVVVATLAGALAIKLRQPYVLGLLVAGMLLGPHQFGVLHESELINLFSEVGAILLLFAIGLEFSVKKLSNLALKAVTLAGVKMGIIILIGYLVSGMLGLQPITGLFLGAILSITSTAIMAKIVSEKNYVNREEVPLLIAALIVEDIIAVFLLAVFAGIGTESELSLGFIISIVNSILIFIIFYLIVSKLLRAVFEWLGSSRANETLAFAALSVGIGLSYAAQFIGIPPSVGAFMAGNFISSLRRGEEFKKVVYPLIFMFSALFFLSIGTVVDLDSIVKNLGLLLILSVVAILAKFIAMGTSYYFVEGNSKSAAFAGLAMISIGEFSLLIAALSKNIVTEIDLMGITTVLVFVTTIATTLFIDKYEAAWRFLRRHAPRRIARGVRALAVENVNALNFFERRPGFGRLFGQLFALMRNRVIAAVIIFSVVFFLLRRIGTVNIAGFETSYLVLTGVLAVLTIIVLFLSVREKARKTARYVDAPQMFSKFTRIFTLSILLWVGVGMAGILALLNFDLKLVLVVIVLIAGIIYLDAKKPKKNILTLEN